MPKTVRHYRIRRNRRAFWEPTPAMRKLGFQNVPLGLDGPEAELLAEQWTTRRDAARTGQAPSPALAAADNLSPERAEELTVYPPRSFGAAFREFRRTAEWAKK